MQTCQRCAWYSFGLFQVIIILIAMAKRADSAEMASGISIADESGIGSEA